MAEIEIGRGLAARPPTFFHLPPDTRQQCVFTADRNGCYIYARGAGAAPAWRGAFTWKYVTDLTVEATDDGVHVTIQDRRPGSQSLELHATSVRDVEALLAPYRPQIGTAPPPPSPEELLQSLDEDDILFEVREGGLEVWFSDELAHGHVTGQ